MIGIPALIRGLADKNNKAAYKCLKELEIISGQNNGVYQFFDTLAGMLSHDNSYVRTRGLLLIAANAKWDTDNKIDEIIDRYLCHIMDEKPITARQCIRSLPNIAQQKPDLVHDIRAALNQADSRRYTGSMQPLIYNDIRAALKMINDL